jgi:hypothetical protein
MKRKSSMTWEQRMLRGFRLESPGFCANFKRCPTSFDEDLSERQPIRLVGRNRITFVRHCRDGHQPETFPRSNVSAKD